MPSVSVTRLRLRSLWLLPAFLLHANRSTRQARAAPGFIAGWLGNELPKGFWTATVWEDAAAMRAFRKSGAHAQAMPKLITWCDEASFVHWDQEGADLPGPDAAHDRLAREGRLSKVARPSPRHQAGRRVGTRPPMVGRPLRPVR
jgi:hypothetical protein